MTLAFAALSSVKRNTSTKKEKKHHHRHHHHSPSYDDEYNSDYPGAEDDDHDHDHFYPYEKTKFSKLKKSLFPWSIASSGYHGSRRSSIGAFFQSICSHEQPLFDSRRRRSTSSFANDALFERYRYRKQSLSNNKLDLSQNNRKPASAPPSSLPVTSQHNSTFNNTNNSSNLSSNNTSTLVNNPSYIGNNNDDDDDELLATPRVVCWQDDKVPRGILVKRNQHRHTSSLQCTSSSSTSSTAGPLHRRSRSTATHHHHHVRHYSHVSYISSSNITAHSEDLTAKQFADLAGIKILPDDIDPDVNNTSTTTDYYLNCNSQTNTTHDWIFDNDGSNIHTHSSIHRLHPHQRHHHQLQQQQQIDDIVSLDEECLSVKSSGLSVVANSNKPTIWDESFWKTNESSTATSTKSSSEEDEIILPPIPSSSPPAVSRKVAPAPAPLPPLPQLPTATTTTTTATVAKLPLPQRKVIKKGRFEIHVESAA